MARMTQRMDFLLHILSYWDSALAVILVLGGLIFFHELGHFIACRLMGIGVVTFSIGMGPKLCSFHRGKTEYRLSWFPFGGYVASVGEYNDEVEELGFTQEEAITNRPAWQRLLMAAAGPFANLLLAFLLYWLVAATAGMAVPLPQIGSVLPGSAAQQAGILPGDMVTAIDGKALSEWNQIPETVGASEGRPLRFTIMRNGEELSLLMTPTRMERTNMFGEQETAWMIGVGSGNAVRYEKLGFFAAAGQGLKQAWNAIDITVQSIKKLVTGSVAAENVGGPIMIAEMLGKSVEYGLISLAMLAAFISINLGLLNLLPIPVLDGGLILFCLVEMLIRRPVPEKIQDYAMRAGVAFLICLMLFATFNDVKRWFVRPESTPQESSAPAEPQTERPQE